MCAVGSEPVNVYNHLDYFLEHNEEVVEWVAQMAKASSGGQVSPRNQSSASSSTSIPSTHEQSNFALRTRSSIPSSSSVPAQANTAPQSSPTSSAIAKSAAATPSIIASPTRTATDFSETQSAQAGNTGSGNAGDTTGAASALVMSPLLVIVAAVVALAT